MNEPIEQKRIGDNSPQATATINDRTALYLVIVAFGFAVFSLAGNLYLSREIGDLKYRVDLMYNHTRDLEDKITVFQKLEDSRNERR